MLPIDAALARYIDSVQRYPRLSRDEERELATRWRERGDRTAAEALARAHLGYVIALALQYRHYGVPLAELVAEGNFGVVQALAKFEPERGNRFVTYAAHWIRAYIVDHVIRSWSLVGSGALRSKHFFKLRRERARIAGLVGEGGPAEQLLAERVGMTQASVGAMLRRFDQRDVSLDAPVRDDSSGSLADGLPAADADQSEQLAAHQERHAASIAVRAALEMLDPRERYVVERRLMADAEDALSLAEIGRRLGVSRERARQLEARAKRKLHRQLTRRTSGAQYRAA